ncbi:S26 family signal peptidase [uncultured Prevotella sp.]|uniref:S26 family signal peptidase n=1 Tax=uncultured Prevotella sp. TaxID=159272 RepID=UPI0025866F8B|nr:S26 family signal peptidase [uncultured Prevotella sp.]
MKSVICNIARFFSYFVKHYKNRVLVMGVTLVGVYLGYWLIHFSTLVMVTDQFIIPTTSMFPTLIPGDRVIVDKTIMGARIYTDFHFRKGGQRLDCFRTKGRRPLRHNDVVVFNFPRPEWKEICFEINNVWCKRILALPGDTLFVENGFYRNNNFDGTLGVIENQKKLADIPDSVLMTQNGYITAWLVPVKWTIKNMGPYYIPRNGDVIRFSPNDVTLYHDIVKLETDKELTWNWEADSAMLDGKCIESYTFQGNYYFLAGDNVLDSTDSRFWGLVPEDYIVGVVKMIFYSKNKATDKVRWDRFLKWV